MNCCHSDVALRRSAEYRSPVRNRLLQPLTLVWMAALTLAVVLGFVIGGNPMVAKDVPLRDRKVTVATAKLSNATRVTVRTSPAVSARLAGDHTPPAASVDVTGPVCRAAARSGG